MRKCMFSSSKLIYENETRQQHILAVVHIFYPELWPELKRCLLNISGCFDLYITLVKENKKVFSDILDVFPDAKIEVIDNRGYDIGPFLYVINKIEINKYDFIVKLHTKRNVPDSFTLKGEWAGGALFRKMALEFCSSSERWKSSLAKMNDISAGMVGSPLCIIDKRFDYTSDYALVYRIMEKIGLNWNGTGEYVVGTMFVVRASLLEPLRGKFTLEDFEVPDRRKGDGLPHAIERVLGYMVQAQGANVVAWDGTNTARQTLLWKLRSLFFEIKYTRRRRIIRVFRIPVFWLPLPKREE